jgi:hypothetical protein
MELSKEKKEEIISILNSDDVDGEDVQEILVRSGWNGQMLVQLMMSESIEDVEYLYKERWLNNLS